MVRKALALSDECKTGLPAGLPALLVSIVVSFRGT